MTNNMHDIFAAQMVDMRIDATLRPAFLSRLHTEKPFTQTFLAFLAKDDLSVVSTLHDIYRQSQHMMGEPFAMGMLLDLGMNDVRGAAVKNLHETTAFGNLEVTHLVLKALELGTLSRSGFDTLMRDAKESKLSVADDINRLIDTTYPLMKSPTYLANIQAGISNHFDLSRPEPPASRLPQRPQKRSMRRHGSKPKGV